MFLVGIFQWWYGAGLTQHIKHSFLGILRTADFFSIGLLARTLFNPFRQISAAQSRSQSSLPEQLSAWFDRLFSRIIGAVARTLFIIIGLMALMIRSLWVVVSILTWMVLPVLPIVGVILWQMGVAP